ncbi:Putative polyketide synthase, ketoreductase domain, NAD(P)-binding domain superfamily [Colletotrichum destructivum]|uniref:Polyketide synthase, ketoreductase domain, NAD(P)-binding domain superfamily n=1 Tax=Colletotrichum destructivum TaxID=34406 RepID=A0AAX4IL43_9PEZI|nr:Putative polyketide synthase, ketoreductase domain, NAD(P)-binding domain superfamily [Colletotrichum destructivum]
MVGAAAGEIGLSLCKWALNNGAKHLVITSRNPSFGPIFLSGAERLSASVRVLPIDVTSREFVEGVVRQIRASIPPVFGVAQRAIVLQDRLLLDMSSDELNGTLAAKLEGTEILISVFSQFESSSAQQGYKLDFFVILSSSAY